LWELISSGEPHLLNMAGLRFLILDEADRMIESGHFPELTSILHYINTYGQKTEVIAADKMLPTEVKSCSAIIMI
jgi:ATP-dependent RNA helicase DDX24/MAK5